MKTKIIPLAISIAALAASNAALAAGTTAGTVINNTATIDYDVGGTPQTEIESSPTGNSAPGTGNGTATDFTVDRMIDLSVTAPGNTIVVPSATGKTLVFTVKNEGNGTQDFNIAINNTVGGDNFDPSNCSIDISSIDNLAAEGTQNVTVTCDIPASPTASNTNNFGHIELTATALKEDGTVLTETAGSDNEDTEDTVFADAAGNSDAARDAKHSAIGKYEVQTATLTVTKTSTVKDMTINGATVNDGSQKRIPGATITYSIVVANTGTVDATNVNIQDTIPANLTYVTGTASITSGAVTVTGANITTSGVTVPAGGNVTLTFDATID